MPFVAWSLPPLFVLADAEREAKLPSLRSILSLLLSKNSDPLDDSEVELSRLGGADRDRTDDIQLAKLALSRLSYGPVIRYGAWWAWKDLNFRPHAYQACALTN